MLLGPVRRFGCRFGDHVYAFYNMYLLLLAGGSSGIRSDVKNERVLECGYDVEQRDDV